MKLILITPPRCFVEEDQIISALFDEGLDILHIKKPNTPPLYSERLLTLIPEKYHKHIVTHEHFDLKEEFNLMGIHLNPSDQPIPENYKGSISTTCSTIEELEKQKPNFDYTILDPIFDCLLPDEYTQRLQPEILYEAKKKKIIDSKVYASGGIKLENIEQIKEFGFGGVAVMSDIWNEFDSRCDHDFQNIIKHFRKLRKALD